MKKIKFLTILALTFIVSQFSYATYMTTATSVSWSGAYASVADGFEAVLYNPAGIYMTQGKWGLDILGSYCLRYYNNTLSTKNIVDFLNKTSNQENMTGYFQQLLKFMPPSGFTTGAELSFMNFISYFNFKKFGLGIAVHPKTKVNFNLSKSVFTSLMQELDLTKKLSFNGSATAMTYYDFCGSISTRFKPFETALGVDRVYVGFGTHVYIPIAFVSAVIEEASLETFKWNNTLGLDGYRVRLKGRGNMAIQKGITDLLGRFGMMPQTSGSGEGGGGFNPMSMLGNSGSPAFGLGLDFGAIVQIKKWIRVGFSVTDLGFIAFPENAEIGVDVTGDIMIDPMNGNPAAAMTNFTSSMQQAFTGSGLKSKKNTKGFGFMPDTAIRTGVAITPLINKFISILIAGDIAVTDLNKPINGAPPTFYFAAGAEVVPKLGWFQFMFRMAFSYNTEANNPCLSFGTGLYLGALKMELAVKGIEALLKDIGAKEFIIGLDCKFSF